MTDADINEDRDAELGTTMTETGYRYNWKRESISIEECKNIQYKSKNIQEYVSKYTDLRIWI